ncbi:MAG: hypothetical protein AB8C84_03835 [Oligoflexales bacterium]
MVSSAISWIIRTAAQGCFWAVVFSIKVDGYAVYDHLRDRFLTDEVVSILEESLTDVWEEWGGKEALESQTQISFEKYRAQKVEY